MQENDIDLKSILSTLRRRWRMIFVTFLVVAGAALVSTFALTPKYTASAQIFVDTKSKDLLDPSSDFAAASSDSARVDSEVEMAQSTKILLEVIAKLSLVTDEEFGVKLGWRNEIMSILGLGKAELPTGADALNEVLGKLSGAVSVRRLGLTFLFEISATSDNPEKSASIANAIASAYIAAQVDSKIQNMLSARDVLESRLTSSSAAVATAEQSFDDFIQTNIDSIAKDAGRADITLLRDELSNARNKGQSQTALADQVQASIQTSDWTSLASTLQDQALAELASQRDQLATQLQAAQGTAKETDLRAELDKINSQIVEKSQNSLKSIREDVAAEQQKVTDLRQQLRTSVLASDLPATVLTQIYGLQQSAEIARSQYQTLLGRVRDLDAQAQVQMADSRLVSEALSPADPSFPNSRLILLLAGMVGLGLGVGLAFLWENYVGGFVTDGQVHSLLHLEVASIVPTHSLSVKNVDKSEVLSPADLMYLSPMSTYAEAVRRLRANIDIALHRVGQTGDKARARGQTILLTSAVPKEGKSSTALALARSYALAGYKTLLIDCDLRKPSIHRYLGVEPKGGLAEYVRRVDEPEALLEAIGSDAHSSLSAIVSGRSSDNPTDQIVSSPSLAHLIDKAREIFDIIVLDSPPLVPVVDGMYLAQYADCSVMIVKWAATSQSTVREALKTLRLGVREGAPILAVLNQQQGERSRYANKYYYYYGTNN